jgi:hypothetical protein
MIDLYCERLAPGFWAEPVNALTNFSFLVAAFSAWRLAAARRVLSTETWALILLIAAIGIGSLLFHTFATGWAMTADVIPILLFQVVFVWVYGGRVIGWGIPGRLLSVALLLAGVAVGARYPEPFNGSLGYAPTLLVLFGLGTHHLLNAPKERSLLLLATGVLALSLTFRSIDLAVCDDWPLGTHFFWHLLNGLVLYLAFRGLANLLFTGGAPGTASRGNTRVGGDPLRAQKG